MRRRLSDFDLARDATDLDPVTDAELVLHDDDRATDVVADDVLGDDRDPREERGEDQHHGIQAQGDEHGDDRERDDHEPEGPIDEGGDRLDPLPGLGDRDGLRVLVLGVVLEPPDRQAGDEFDD